MESVGILMDAFTGAAPVASLSWPAVVGTFITMNVGTMGDMGNGDFTLAALTKPSGNHGIVGMKVSSAFNLQILCDSNIWFGGGDFSGFGTAVTGDWQWIAHSKASGSNVYNWHYLNYTTNLGGSPTHTAGSGTHANPGTITAVQIGECDNRGNGLIAVVAAWKRVLSNAEINSMFTANLADTRSLSPDALWPCNVAAASVVDTTGHGANASSVSGTITPAAAPPGFTF